MIQFGDSAQGAAAIPFDYAALYGADCDYPADKGIAGVKYDKEHTRWITFKGDPHASIIDFEPDTRDYQKPALVREWLLGREAEDTHRRAWIYCDLSDAHLAARYARGLDFQWWLATLDGVRRSRQELSQLLLHYGVPRQYTATGLIAAHQWKETIESHSTYDSDLCFVDADW